MDFFVIKHDESRILRSQNSDKMGLPAWAQKAWGWTKTAAGKVGSAIKTGAQAAIKGIKYVGKAAKPVTRVVSKVLDFVEDAPGMVGDVAGIARKYLDKFNNWVEEKVPEGALKRKMKEASSDAGDLVDRGERYGKEKAEKVAGYGRQGRKYVDKADEYARFARHIDE